jgi:hypothetical protein
MPDGSRMAARSDPIDLTVAGVTRQEAAVVVDLAAFDCILGLPWLEDHNPVISWKKMKLLVPTPDGAVEVDLEQEPMSLPRRLSVTTVDSTAPGNGQEGRPCVCRGPEGN